MLTGDLVRPRLRKRGSSSLEVEMLPVNVHWRRSAADLITLFQQHVDQPRYIWENALSAYEGDRTDYAVLRGLAKVLADAATFTPLDRWHCDGWAGLANRILARWAHGL
jgi:predicted nuclease of restriction endonuclease-like RecB superfamily